MPDIFISYSRRDSEFVHKLVDSLTEQGRDLWVDFEDIPFGSDWWAEIVEGIESSDTSVFCISPDSIASEVCSLEIAEIIKNHKKLVPIVVREPGKLEKPLPHALSHLNWIFFTDESKYEESLAHLIETIDTDLDVEKDKTRLLVRAREWEDNGHNNSMLLRGDELQSFLLLLDDDGLTELQRNYLNISHRHDMNRQQMLRFAFGFLSGVLAFGFYVFATFRSNNFISPKRVTLTLAGGEIFGLFIGIISVFGQDMLFQLRNRIPKALYLPVQIGVCLVAGILAWVMFQGVILEFWPGLTTPILAGGIGLAAGFVLNALIKPPPVVTVMISFIGIFLPIWLFNSQIAPIETMDFRFNNPLIYFDAPRSVFTVGIPMALLLAFGANLQLLWRQWQRIQSGTKNKRKAKVTA